MKKNRLVVLAACCLLLLAASGAWALDVPAYNGRVTDLANMMSPGTRASMEKYLAELERTDSTQIAVLTIPSLDGDSMSDFSIRVAEAWKIGQKGNDNGVLLLVSKGDRKVRIEVGYGLEGVLTDVLSSQIIQNVIGPQFKTGNFDKGFADGVTAIAGAVRGEYTAAPTQRKRRSRSGILPLIVIPMLIFITMTEMFGRRKRRGQLSDGQVVDGQHRRGSGLGSTASTLFFLSMLGGGRGFGGGGGGFGDGGGFGGFGGGGFGGGGAGGDW